MSFSSVDAVQLVLDKPDIDPKIEKHTRQLTSSELIALEKHSVPIVEGVKSEEAQEFCFTPTGGTMTEMGNETLRGN